MILMVAEEVTYIARTIELWSIYHLCSKICLQPCGFCDISSYSLCTNGFIIFRWHTLSSSGISLFHISYPSVTILLLSHLLLLCRFLEVEEVDHHYRIHLLKFDCCLGPLCPIIGNIVTIPFFIFIGTELFGLNLVVQFFTAGTFFGIN